MKPEIFITNAKRLRPLVKDDHFAVVEAKQLLREYFGEGNSFTAFYENEGSRHLDKILELAIRYIENVHLPETAK